MRILIKLLAISFLLTGCAKMYETKTGKNSKRNTDQTSQDISNHIVDVGHKAAVDAASVPTNINP